MIVQGEFSSAFDVEIVDLPSAPADYAFSAEGSGARVIAVAVEPSGASPWLATFASPEPGRRSLTALLGTPSPTGLCVVERGTAFIGDVLEPDCFEVVATPGPVVAAEALPTEKRLLLVTPWAITAIGKGGVLWTSPRIAIDGLRVDEASGGWVRGVADPQDDEPREFALDLSDGRVIGGADVA